MIRNILVTLFLSTSFIAFGQRFSSSPYSYFGIGEEFSSRTVEQNAMGGIGVAYGHYKYLNFTNPAAFSKVRFTTYTLGAFNHDLTVKTNTNSQSSTSTSLSYVAVAFPVGQKAAISFGLQPISAIGYSLNNSIFDTSGNLEQYSSFEGTGGVHRIYAALGYNVFKGLSLGIEGDFNFGNLENSILSQTRNVALATRFTENSNVRGGSIKLGALYEHQLKNQLTVTAGVSVKLANELSLSGSDYFYSLAVTNSGAEIPKDTLSSNSINGKFNLPLRSTIGIGLGKLDKWYVGAEYEMQDAFSTTNLTSISTGPYRYDNKSRFSVGGFYLPKINSISSYFDRITYRAGLRIERSGLLIDGTGTGSNFTSINDFGINFGLGLPLKRLSTINVGVEYGQRGTLENNLVKENYLNLRLSLSLTDLNWFQKRKID
ncbi:MAG: hypothetical protein HWD82_02500 [Flavobacteriaceae bacterium]|nr:hypothetical protein [Flavobacteriaceae bacterium]